jgi:hypothetical protein
MNNRRSIRDDLASIFETSKSQGEEDNKNIPLLNEDNPFSKDRFIDQKLDNTSHMGIKSSASSTFPIDSKMNINDLIKGFNNLNNTSSTTRNTNLILNPTITTIPMAKTQTEKPTLQQIIDEFDPMNQSNGLEEKKTSSTTTLNQNSFANLTPRPFNQQMVTSTIGFNKQSISPQKPNYNVNLPLVNSSQMFRHPQINYNNNFTPQQQQLPPSQSFTSASTMSSSAYYASNFNNKPQSYRPVHFTAPISNIKFPPRSTSTDFSNLPNNQQPQ